jgi:Holliday junction DNA helicase RuvB
MNLFDSIYEALGITACMDYFKGKGDVSSDNKGEEKKPYHADQITPVKFNYRPSNLTEYTGQERAKSLVNLTIKKIKCLKPVHICISGAKGAGKSTLAMIIAKELNAKIHWYIGGAFSMDNLRDFLLKNQEDKEHLYVLFVDEGHNLEKSLAEYLYPILEDFILPEGESINLKPFIFITATTEKNTLYKKFAPLVDRCGCDIVLEQYNSHDIKSILKNYNDKIYQKNISEEIYDILSVNVRYTPRIALSFLDDYITCEDIKQVLDAHRVIKNGLTVTDLSVLEHLSEIKKPVGIEALACIAGVTREDFQYCIEPYLLFNNFLTRTSRGRLLTKKGEQLLEELKNEKIN